MKITFLGTGTSQGVPVIGCECPVCSSSDERDQRLRTSVLIADGGVRILIDAGPDFRRQMLAAGVKHLDAILLTHEHNDHVIGLDDIRPLNYASGKAMRIYALPRVLSEVRKRFEYVFTEKAKGLPEMELHAIDENADFSIEGIRINAVGVEHGRLPILGFRFERFCYLTDVKTMRDEEIRKIEGIPHLVLNALHHNFHPTHLSLVEALALIEKIRPGNCRLTHVSHSMGKYEEVSKMLPKNVTFAYDGLTIDV